MQLSCNISPDLQQTTELQSSIHCSHSLRIWVQIQWLLQQFWWEDINGQSFVRPTPADTMDICCFARPTIAYSSYGMSDCILPTQLKWANRIVRSQFNLLRSIIEGEGQGLINFLRVSVNPFISTGGWWKKHKNGWFPFVKSYEMKSTIQKFCQHDFIWIVTT